MANKQTDPIQALANDIVNTIDSVATRRSDKASFDKSFYATILGVNRKFTDDVSAEDQDALIAKYSIPETVSEGEYSYFTFKINGSYYVKSQYGNFKLYDNVMVYIPNGDWSRMYVDYPTGDKSTGGGGSDPVVLPKVTAAPTRPASILEGDFLAMVENDDTLTTLYRYINHEWTSVPFEYGTNPGTLHTEGTYYGMFAAGDLRTIFLYENGSLQQLAYAYDNPNILPNVFFKNEVPAELAAVGDYWLQIDNYNDNNLYSVQRLEQAEDAESPTWNMLYNAAVPVVYIQPTQPSASGIKEGAWWIQIDNTTDKNIRYIKKYTGYTWATVCIPAGGSGDVTINISHAILVKKEELM